MNLENERQTRKRRIDPKLASAGWSVAPFDPSRSLSDYPQCAIEEYETDNGPADYALNVDSVLLGIVEAKKLTLGPQNVLTQAERYSRGATGNPLYFDGFHVPFLYSTNGEVIWFHDDYYIDLLRNLGKNTGLLGDIYAGAQSRFSNPVNLKK